MFRLALALAWDWCACVVLALALVWCDCTDWWEEWFMMPIMGLVHDAYRMWCLLVGGLACM